MVMVSRFLVLGFLPSGRQAYLPTDSLVPKAVRNFYNTQTPAFSKFIILQGCMGTTSKKH